MAIGVNWEEVWDPVWDSVWDQSGPAPALAVCINWKPVWTAAWGPVWRQTAPVIPATPTTPAVSQLDGRRYEWIFRDDEDICLILAAAADSLCD